MWILYFMIMHSIANNYVVCSQVKLNEAESSRILWDLHATINSIVFLFKSLHFYVPFYSAVLSYSAIIQCWNCHLPSSFFHFLHFLLFFFFFQKPSWLYERFMRLNKRNDSSGTWLHWPRMNFSKFCPRFA